MKIVKNTFVVEKKRIRHGLEKVASCSQKYILMASLVNKGKFLICIVFGTQQIFLNTAFAILYRNL